MINNTRWNTFRNKVFVRLANFILLGTQKEYRDLVHGAIDYGLVAAARDAEKRGLTD